MGRIWSLTQDAFAQASQAEVGSLEGLAPLLIQWQLLALDEDGATALQHALGGALHDEHVPRVSRVLQRVDGQLWAEEEARLWARGTEGLTEPRRGGSSLGWVREGLSVRGLLAGKSLAEAEGWGGPAGLDKGLGVGNGQNLGRSWTGAGFGLRASPHRGPDS